MKNLFVFIILFSSFNGFGGDGSTNILQVSPNNIDTNTEVVVGLNISPCRVISDDFYFEVDGNEITFIIASVGVSPCPPGIVLFNYNVGTVPQGQYRLTAYETYGFTMPDDPFDPNVTLTQIGEPVSFGVRAPRMVPTLGWLGIVSMLFVFLVFAFFIFKNRVHL